MPVQIRVLDCGFINDCMAHYKSLRDAIFVVMKTSA